LFLKAGYTIDIVEEELQELFEKKLISTSDYTEDIEELVEIDSTSMISITSVGVYYLNRLMGKFHYLDLVVQDTPIYDDEFYDKITQVFPDSDENGNRNLQARKTTVEEFVNYLKSQAKKDKKFESNFTDDIIMFDIGERIQGSVNSDFERLEKIIERML
jgi:hypothetical protein